MKRKVIWMLPLAALLAAGTVLAQSTPASHDATLARQLEDARQQLADQAALLNQMRAELTRQAAAINELRTHQAAIAPAGLSGTAEDAPRLQNAVLAMRGGMPVGHPMAVAQRTAPDAKPAADKPAELFLRIGNARLTPGGFIDFTTIYRSTNVGSLLATSFQSIPYNNTVQGGLSEVRFTAQGTRLSLRLDETVGKARVYGYAEADFNGYLAGNGEVSTNSNSLRMRAFYVNLAQGKWELLGGQQWSLLTPTRKALSPQIADMFIPGFIDSGYQAGLVYSRQPQVRLVYHPTQQVSAALSLENPEQYAGSAVTFPALFPTTEIDIGSSTGSGGANATPNLHPDVIARLTYDHAVNGLPWHGSIAGMLTSTRIITPVSVTKTVTAKDSREGGAITGNMALDLTKNFRFVSTGYWSDGGGRYIGGMGPQAVVLQNGTTASPFSVAMIHSGSGIAGFEWTVRKTALTGLGSAAYYQRRYGVDPSVTSKTTYVGYGFPGSANTNNRVIREYSLATTTTLWKNVNYGALLFITQSSYVWRAPWYVAPGSPKDAHTFMQFANLRYVIP